MVGAFKNIKRLLSKAQSVGLTHPQCVYLKTMFWSRILQLLLQLNEYETAPMTSI